jgi:hypothetical protein
MATPHRSRRLMQPRSLIDNPHPLPFARPYSTVELHIECALLPRSAVCEPCRRGAGLLSSLALVSGKSQRRAARSVVADYHHVQLGDLVARVGEAVDRYRAGELDAFDVDRVLFQYSRAAKELWKFCNILEAETAAAVIQDQPPHDWWERAAPRQRP